MRRRSPSPRTPGSKKNSPGQRALARALVACVLVFLAMIGTSAFFKRASHFKIKEILIKESYRSSDPMQALGDPPEGSIDLSYLKGRSLFSLDLAQEALRIKAAYPRYQAIRLIKILPNRLFVHCIKRRAIAIVAIPRYFFLGEDLALSPVPRDVNIEEAGLPVIVGLEKKLAGARPGKKYFVPELMLARGILREVRIHSELKKYGLKKIDVSNSENPSIFVNMLFPVNAAVTQKHPAAQVLEVRLGQDGLKAKIILLNELFLHYRQKLTLLEYIDLRFKEPVIKLRDEKK